MREDLRVKEVSEEELDGTIGFSGSKNEGKDGLDTFAAVIGWLLDGTVERLS